MKSIMWSLKKQHFLLFLLFSWVLISCNGQTKSASQRSSTSSVNKMVGGGCDGCELMYVDMPAELQAIDTSAGWQSGGQKLHVTGKVYQSGGKKPASDIIIYYWQTDANGYYTPKKGMDPRARRHGHLRGWVKTNKDGKYDIYTVRPAPYPNNNEPAHIHLSVKEPNIADEYYIDELVFDDDKLLTGTVRRSLENRGGSGVLRLLVDGDIQVAEHDIVLGLNIPEYPTTNTAKVSSGLAIGEDNPSFTPYHAYGPDKGTKTCPVCKYGRYNGIVYFVGNHPNWEDIKTWLQFLEFESDRRKAYLKAYFVYGNENDYSHEARQKELEMLGKELDLQYTALTFVPSFSDKKSEVVLNKVNPEVENTIVIYKNRAIIDKYIDLAPTKENLARIAETLDASQNDLFGLPSIFDHE
ncbi:intradiol ring-cleavage dioxygenase [uncultured Muriicola sp.]|uniref:dioxygenase family protein n=1 Tax=uncultured Muriicola sp. TaxID=1583102 RepID=UPI0026284F69|nr:intradiol ring-cleavage dioxygenase [uncultured Muriicola sp.]